MSVLLLCAALALEDAWSTACRQTLFVKIVLAVKHMNFSSCIAAKVMSCSITLALFAFDRSISFVSYRNSCEGLPAVWIFLGSTFPPIASFNAREKTKGGLQGGLQGWPTARVSG